jgi:hypothetical protein
LFSEYFVEVCSVGRNNDQQSSTRDQASFLSTEEKSMENEEYNGEGTNLTAWKAARYNGIIL